MQKNIYKNRVKKTRYQKECQIFAGIFKSLLSSQSACSLLLIIVCNITKIVTNRVKLLEKPFLKWCKNGPFDLCKDVPISKAGGCQFDNLTLSNFDFAKIIFLEKRQNPAICDFFRWYEEFSFNSSYFCHFLLFLSY